MTAEQSRPQIEHLPSPDLKTRGLADDIKERCTRLGITEIQLNPSLGERGLPGIIFRRTKQAGSEDNVYFLADQYDHLAALIGIDYLAFLRESGVREGTALGHRDPNSPVLPLATAQGNFGEIEISQGTFFLRQELPLSPSEAKYLELMDKAHAIVQDQAEEDEEEGRLDKIYKELEFLDPSYLQQYARRFGIENLAGLVRF